MSETPRSDPLHDAAGDLRRFHDVALAADRRAHERASREALDRVAADLRRVGFHIDAGELAQLLYPPGPGVPVSIAGQEYLAQPREDGQPGLRLVHRLAAKPEREHR